MTGEGKVEGYYDEAAGFCDFENIVDILLPAVRARRDAAPLSPPPPPLDAKMTETLGNGAIPNLVDVARKAALSVAIAAPDDQHHRKAYEKLLVHYFPSTCDLTNWVHSLGVATVV